MAVSLGQRAALEQLNNGMNLFKLGIDHVEASRLIIVGAQAVLEEFGVTNNISVIELERLYDSSGTN